MSQCLKRHARDRESDGEGELNTVPYLDILMNLIVFMLLSMSGLAAVGVVNVTATRPRPSVSRGAAEPPLTVAIGAEGFEVTGQAEGPGWTIPRAPDGAYDYPALTAYLARAKEGGVAGTRLLLTAAEDTAYETVVATLDACRETHGEKKRLLFPEVSLGSR